MKSFLALAVALLALAPFASAQDNRTLFPEGWYRGFLDFQFAPPHNEPDLGACTVPTSTNARCAAFARYVWSGYLEIQPFGTPYLRRLFLFADPKFYGGDNLPGLRYSGSGSLIAWERTVGAGIILPKNFELRVTHHDVDFFGKYDGLGSVVNLSRNGPLGLYTTVGVRWYFGKYGRNVFHE